MRRMDADNDPKQWTKAGYPRAAVVESIVGFDTDEKERREAWKIVSAELEG